jgi:hypothetical protein
MILRYKKYIFNTLLIKKYYVQTQKNQVIRKGPNQNNNKNKDSIKVVNSVSVGVLFFQLEWNVSVSECFGVPFRGCTVHIYSTNIIQIQEKLIINYAIQHTIPNKYNFKI